jgi:K+-transporting ATPase ATPase B chain
MLVGGVNVRLEVVAGVVALWLWLTVLFTNFADALAEGCRKDETESLSWSHHPVKIKWLKLPPPRD